MTRTVEWGYTAIRCRSHRRCRPHKRWDRSNSDRPNTVPLAFHHTFSGDPSTHRHPLNDGIPCIVPADSHLPRVGGIRHRLFDHCILRGTNRVQKMGRQFQNKQGTGEETDTVPNLFSGTVPLLYCPGHHDAYSDYEKSMRAAK